MNKAVEKIILCIYVAVLCLPPMLVAQEKKKEVERFPDLDLLLAPQKQGKGNQTLVIRGKWVWDGTGKPAISGGVVLIQGDRIVAAGAEGKVTIPSDAVWIDKRDLFLMPGLVDAHEHYAMDQWAGVSQGELMARSAGHLALRAARNGRTALRNGVTTARIATEIVKYDKDYVALDYARAFNEDLLPGPRCVAGGHKLHPPSQEIFYPADTGSQSGVDDLRRVVREDIRAGADFCKMFLSGNLVPGADDNSVVDAVYFTKEEIDAVIEECHRYGKKVSGHVLKGGPSVQAAITDGIDSFEHPILFTRAEWQQLKNHNIFAVLTESQLFVPGAKAAGWGGHIDTPPNAEAILRNEYLLALTSGAKLAVGAGGYQQPWAMAHEIAVLVYYGMTNQDALLVATRNGGELTGLPVGTLEPGKYADVIGIRGNPLEDIGSLKQVGFVMKGGKVYDLSEQ